MPGNLELCCQDARRSSSSSPWRLRSRTGIMLRCQPQQGARNLALPASASASARKYWTQPPWPSWCFNTCTWYPPCPPASFPEPSTAHKFSNTTHTGRKKVWRWCQLELLPRKNQGASGQGYSTRQRLDQSLPPSTANRCPPHLWVGAFDHLPFCLLANNGWTLIWINMMRSCYCSPARPSDLLLSPAAGSWWHH